MIDRTASSGSASSRFMTANDGLKLHVRCFEPSATGKLPVVCLPGLARTAEDFEVLASALVHRQGRRVLALDYRGRGLSDYDVPKNYTLPVELTDVLAVVTALEAMPAIFVGTSRGGILTMLLAAVRPTVLAGVILNDIGPVIEPQGLMRIKGYVGKLPQPTSFEDGALILKRLFDAQFPKLTQDDWRLAARRTFKQVNGQLLPTYDVRLAETLVSLDPERPPPVLWPQFEALAHVPVLSIRGANSDILSVATVNAMALRHPRVESFEVPDQGHAPLLADEDTINRIAEFTSRVEAPS